ncbi:MAG: phage portal protein [Lachnospiraceae bacterium]|nr:phage portal protein [Lachnospiraceae bacterium]
MAELKGKAYLKKKLNSKKTWVQTRYDYYELKNLKRDNSPVIPDGLIARYESKLGWCTKAVDSLANRLIFDGFDNDNFDLWEIFEYNNKDVLFDSAIRSALIGGCCFVYISADEEGYPRLQVIDGKNATGNIDPITNLLTEGYAILETDDHGQIITDAYFDADHTEYSYRNGKDETVRNQTGYPLLVPVIYRPDANRPFGQSRISRDCMDLQDKARFTLTRMEVAAEFYSFPQKYILGTAQDSDFDTVKATYTSFLEISGDEDGNKPTAGQFAQASLAPLIDQFHTYAKAFAGITGLTTDDLGFISENPSSAESIKAGHGDLERLASKAQDTFGSGFLNVGLVAACLRDNFHYRRRVLYETTPLWKPAFSMDNSSIGSFGDAILKINEAVPNAIGPKTIERLTGIPIENG